MSSFKDLSGKVAGVLTGSASETELNKAAGANRYKNRMKIAGPALTRVDYGVAVRKGNRKVLDVLNAELKKVVGSGECAAIKRKWIK